MVFKCAHISDVHWRGLKRHDEYKKIFADLFNKLYEIKPNIIFIGGDIVHTKTQGISPEVIEMLHWWFESLASIAPTHVILGNHDGLILNKNRQDAITPIVQALNNENVFLYKKSGVYNTGIEGFNWCVYSCFDEENWVNVKPVKNQINIGCFHGAVWGSKTDVDWELEGEVSRSFFDECDFTFLGDIHKFQYLDEEKRIAYPGSTIQQNYGEDIKKGFLLWEINNKFDYNSTFISIENPHPFVTIPWKSSVKDTIPFISKIKKRARFRIKSSEQISQIEIQLLHHYLKEEKLAHEIVYQIDTKDELKNNADLNSSKVVNINNSLAREVLFEDFFGENIDKGQISKIEELYKKSLSEIIQQDYSIKSKMWKVNSLKFDNTFSYCNDNVINFDNLEGVVGLFGNNRSGKSSIPGTLMYCLFNSSDRGSLKNKDIVNIRKGSCKATVKITCGTKKYTVERVTKKSSNKKGEVSSTTNLSLMEDSQQLDQSEEQRRETEKTIRDIIGNADDFLYTTFAAQGEMNTFVKEKSSARKTVLSKFLNLNIYEEIYKSSREEYIVLKNKLKSIKEKDWDKEISNCFCEIKTNKIKKEEKENYLSKLRDNEVNLKILLNENKNKQVLYKGYNFESANEENKFLTNKLNINNVQLEKFSNELIEIKDNISKINKFKSLYSLTDLENDKNKLDVFTNKLKDFKRSKIFLQEEEKRNNRSLKILDEVPCDERYSSCKFIKGAHESKKDKKKIENEINEILSSIRDINVVLSSLKEKNVESKIKKYNDVLLKEVKYKMKRSNLDKDIENVNLIKTEYLEKQEKLKEVLQFLEKNADKNLKDNKDEIKLEIIKNDEKISDSIFETKNIDREIFTLDHKIEELKKEKEEYYNIIEKWKTFDLFSFSCSKKGIPTMLIRNSLPKINNEINKILTGVTTFKIFLEEEGNNLQVYIDYGDSKRIIECASGMEKMMTSIAIRVALINISFLPKSDLFIIDEGFGSLDDTNIESCSRLLQSLKKYFKTILVISHVDSIKDIVDKNIVINKKGSDSYVCYE
jgi:DNA repair exonuclease SbcCD ATPase subunit